MSITCQKMQVNTFIHIVVLMCWTSMCQYSYGFPWHLLWRTVWSAPLCIHCQDLCLHVALLDWLAFNVKWKHIYYILHLRIQNFKNTSTEQNVLRFIKQYRKLHAYLIPPFQHWWINLSAEFGIILSILRVFHVILSLYRGSLWDGGTNHLGCTLMTTPTATRPVPARSAHMAHGMEASPITCARQRMWRRSWTTVPAPTGQKERKVCWACRISSRAKEY